MRAHVHFTESLPALVSILAISGLVLPTVAAYVGLVTVLLKLLGLILVLNQHRCGSSGLKIIMYLLSDVFVYLLGLVAFVWMIVDLRDY